MSVHVDPAAVKEVVNGFPTIRAGVEGLKAEVESIGAIAKLLAMTPEERQQLAEQAKAEASDPLGFDQTVCMGCNEAELEARYSLRKMKEELFTAMNEAAASLYGAVADVLPVVGAVKGGYEAYKDPSTANVVLAVLGIAPELGPLAKGTGKLSGVIDELLRTADKAPRTNIVADVRSITAEAANAPFVQRGQFPPYDLSSPVKTFVTKQEVRFLRFSIPDRPTGQFLVRADEIAGMTPQQIQRHLALPNMPTHVGVVVVPAGTKMQVGRVAAQPAFGVNQPGGIQYQLLQDIPNASFLPRAEIGGK